MRQTILLIDASPLIYSNFNSIGFLESGNGEPTGLRYGFLRSTRSYTEKNQADRTVLCFDLPGLVKKAEGHSTYKSNRVWTEEKNKMYGQVPELREMLSLTKYTQADAEGYEADDVIGSLARQMESQGHLVVIVSPDNDMAQLVSENVLIFDPKAKRKTEMYKGPLEVYRDLGVWPEHLLHFRALTGDKSDNLAGPLTGEGWKVKLRAEFAKMPKERVGRDTFINEWWPKMDESLPMWTDPGLEMYRTNYHLMSLHDPENLNIKKGARDKEQLSTLFDRLQFKSMKKFLDNIAGAA